MPEWLNGAVSKTVEPVKVPRVRIPFSPPFFINMDFLFYMFLLGRVKICNAFLKQYIVIH